MGGWAAGRVPHSARVSDTRFATRASSSATACDAAAAGSWRAAVVVEEEEEFTQKHYQKGLQKSTHTTTDYPYAVVGRPREREFTNHVHNILGGGLKLKHGFIFARDLGFLSHETKPPRVLQ